VTAVAAEPKAAAGRRLAIGRVVGSATAIIVFALIPQLSFTKDETFFWTGILILAMHATATNLLLGYTGLVSFGQAAFFGAGSYTVGMMMAKGDYDNMPVNLLLGLVFGGLMALAVGAVIVRTSGLAFAILTLAFLQLFATMAFKEKTFGGENGLSGIKRGDFGPFDLVPTNNFYYFTLAVLVVVMGMLWLVVSSPFGLTLRSIRDDADRAQFLGIPVRLYKLGVFMIAGLVGGLAGALNAYHNLFTSAEVFSLDKSAEPVLMSILGGTSYFFGPLVGAVTYEWLSEWLQDRTESWILWMGIGLVIIIVALRKGIVGLFFQIWHAAEKRLRPSAEEGV
jgi:branched-chain amino acid transport system permease protein